MKNHTVTIHNVVSMEQLKSEFLVYDKKYIERTKLTIDKRFNDILSVEFLVGCPKIEEVVITGGTYSKIDLSSIDMCKPLERIVLGMNDKITEIDIRHLLGAPRIRDIRLFYLKKLKYINMDNISKCKTLRSLSISGVNIIPDLSLISECNTLRSLTIPRLDNEVGLTPISRLRDLRFLEIEYDTCGEKRDESYRDCTPLLSLQKLMFYSVKEHGGSHRANRQICLPKLVYPVCGTLWPRVNNLIWFPDEIMYTNIPEGNWGSIYPLLQEYALEFAPEYWHGLNKYILDKCAIDYYRYHIDLSRLIIPSDLLELIEPINSRRPRTMTIEERLDDNVIKLVEKYLDVGYSTKGFDTESVLANEPILSSFVSKIDNMRKQELKGLTFVRNRIAGGDYYYIHELLDTVYGERALKMLEFHDSSYSKKRYSLTRTEIEEIESEFNILGFETDWLYISQYEYIHDILF